MSFFPFAEKMLQMGFTLKEIHESLTENRYDEVCATYMLLQRESSSSVMVVTHTCHISYTHEQMGHVHVTSEVAVIEIVDTSFSVLMTVPYFSFPPSLQSNGLSLTSLPSSNGPLDSYSQDPSQEPSTTTSASLLPPAATKKKMSAPGTLQPHVVVSQSLHGKGSRDSCTSLHVCVIVLMNVMYMYIASLVCLLFVILHVCFLPIVCTFQHCYLYSLYPYMSP